MKCFEKEKTLLATTKIMPHATSLSMHVDIHCSVPVTTTLIISPIAEWLVHANVCSSTRVRISNIFLFLSIFLAKVRNPPARLYGFPLEGGGCPHVSKICDARHAYLLFPCNLGICLRTRLECLRTASMVLQATLVHFNVQTEKEWIPGTVCICYCTVWLRCKAVFPPE